MNAKFKFSDSLNLIKSFKTSGTITPSSKSLIKTLLAPIDFKSASCIIELGPGTGCVTRSILERMSPDCVLICFEVNGDFIEQLTALQDSRLRVVNACASSIRTILDELEYRRRRSYRVQFAAGLDRRSGGEEYSGISSV